MKEKRRAGNLLGPRGFLANWPEDVIMVVNGRPITKADHLEAKIKRQRRELEAKLRIYEPSFAPCFIWVFWTDGLILSGFFMGWYLYVHTLRISREISIRRDEKLVLTIMRIFPCGYFPIVENFEPWKEAFASAYHRPTIKRSEKQGMAVARAAISPAGHIVDVIPSRAT